MVNEYVVSGVIKAKHSIRPFVRRSASAFPPFAEGIKSGSINRSEARIRGNREWNTVLELETCNRTGYNYSMFRGISPPVTTEFASGYNRGSLEITETRWLKSNVSGGQLEIMGVVRRTNHC